MAKELCLMKSILMLNSLHIIICRITVLKFSCFNVALSQFPVLSCPPHISKAVILNRPMGCGVWNY